MIFARQLGRGTVQSVFRVVHFQAGFAAVVGPSTGALFDGGAITLTTPGTVQECLTQTSSRRRHGGVRPTQYDACMIEAIEIFCPFEEVRTRDMYVSMMTQQALLFDCCHSCQAALPKDAQNSVHATKKIMIVVGGTGIVRRVAHMTDVKQSPQACARQQHWCSAMALVMKLAEATLRHKMQQITGRQAWHWQAQQALAIIS